VDLTFFTAPAGLDPDFMNLEPLPWLCWVLLVSPDAFLLFVGNDI
jgi:hypothetical protein